LLRVIRGLVDLFVAFNGRRTIIGVLDEITSVHTRTASACLSHQGSTCCEQCNDGDGRSIYPLYGVAPHTCFYKIPGATIGQSVELPETDWPANFVLDPESGAATGSPRTGVWTHCLHCGTGDSPSIH
jgi:hypothetical protein